MVAGETYVFRITARIDGIPELNSKTEGEVTIYFKPAKPSLLAYSSDTTLANAEQPTFVVVWTEGDLGGAASKTYTISRKEAGADESTYASQVVATNRAEFTGLAAGSKYDFRIKVMNN